jgi:hypothetical protein
MVLGILLVRGLWLVDGVVIVVGLDGVDFAGDVVLVVYCLGWFLVQRISALLAVIHWLVVVVIAIIVIVVIAIIVIVIAIIVIVIVIIVIIIARTIISQVIHSP